MAYAKCEWCGKNLNGYENIRRHEESKHPREKAIRGAREEVLRRQHYVAMAELELSRLHDYRAALALPGMPQQALLLVERELRRSIDRKTRNGMTVEESMAWEAEYDKAELLKATQLLATLEAIAAVEEEGVA